MNKAVSVSGFVGLAALLFGFGYAKKDLESGHAPNFGGLSSFAGKSGSAAPETTVKHVYNLIEENYYLPVKPTPLKYAAISGMMASLGDPHTRFLPPKEKEDFEFTTTAKFVGIGCALQDDPMGVRFTDVFEDSPASHAGLKPGDVVTAVDGNSIVGKVREKVVNMIRGVEGTIVHLTILRDGKGKPEVVPVKRARVFTPTVQSYYLPDSQIGILSIATFSEPTVDQFDDKLNRLTQKGLKGLIIDLRENPGGLLETASELIGRFAENKTVIRMRQKDGGEEVVTSPSGFKRNLGVPIAILINEDSASASEIFAGVMRDYGLATLVGNHSYGKESVQNISQMIDGAGVKVTIARYYLPVTPDFGRKVDVDGQYVSGGLQPDVLVKLEPEARPVPGKPQTDAQLAKAVSLLQTKLP
jgi:carboxyl-terminal processing protease